MIFSWVGMSVAFLSGVFILSLAATIYTWLMRRKLKEAGRTLIPLKGGCVSDHEWRRGMLIEDTNHDKRTELLICQACGKLGDESGRMLNKNTLKSFRTGVISQEDDRVLDLKVSKRLSFEITAYYDRWLVFNKERLLVLLKGKGNPEELYTMLDNFFLEGSKNVNEMSARARLDIQEESKRGH